MTILDQFRLDGKRALITGGSRGLGRAMAQALAEAGADLVLVGRDTATLNDARRDLTAVGRRGDVVQADFPHPPVGSTACDAILEQHGPIDILINNVGGRRENIPLVEQSLEDWRKLIDLNLTSTFACTKKIAGPMLERGWGRIINIASICGQVATRNIH